jgi:quinol monooxygenase YgiN
MTRGRFGSPNRQRMTLSFTIPCRFIPAQEEMDMSEKITLVVRFGMDESAKQEFIAKLQQVFTHIVKEETFVEASLVQDMRDPKSILNYEVWNESPESFMKNQMSKAYRAEFEKMIVNLKIDRVPAWYSTIADWKKA